MSMNLEAPEIDKEYKTAKKAVKVLQSEEASKLGVAVLSTQRTTRDFLIERKYCVPHLSIIVAPKTQPVWNQERMNDFAERVGNHLSETEVSTENGQERIDVDGVVKNFGSVDGKFQLTDLFLREDPEKTLSSGFRFYPNLASAKLISNIDKLILLGRFNIKYDEFYQLRFCVDPKTLSRLITVFNEYCISQKLFEYMISQPEATKTPSLIKRLLHFI